MMKPILIKKKMEEDIMKKTMIAEEAEEEVKMFNANNHDRNLHIFKSIVIRNLINLFLHKFAKLENIKFC